jgi:hypothetical protein
MPSVSTPAEIYQVLDRGTSKRRTAETLLNKRSSRSHRCVFFSCGRAAFKICVSGGIVS